MFKGGVCIVGFVLVGDLVYVIEILLEKLISGEGVQVVILIGVLEVGFDCLYVFVQWISQNKGICYLQDIINYLFVFVGEEVLVECGEEMVLVVVVMLVCELVVFVVELFELLLELLLDGYDEVCLLQEQICVCVELLDNLVNYVGEVVIYCLCLEQQVVGYCFNLVELEQMVV